MRLVMALEIKFQGGEMKRECFIVTNDSYFYLGMSKLISEFPETDISRISFNSLFKTSGCNNLALFVVYLDDMLSNFKALLFFERMNNNVVFLSKNNNVMKLCSKFGYDSVKIKTFMGVYAMIRQESKSGDRMQLLSNMEKNVIVNLLDGESNIKLAKRNRLSDKTISHHKRSALLKVGVDNINVFFDNISKDIFKVI